MATTERVAEFLQVKEQKGASQWAMGRILYQVFGNDGETAADGVTMAQFADEVDLDVKHLRVLRRVYRLLGEWHAAQVAPKPPYDICRMTALFDPGMAVGLMESWLKGRPKRAAWREHLLASRRRDRPINRLQKAVRVAERIASSLNRRYAELPKTKAGNPSLRGLGRDRAQKLSDALEVAVTLRRCANAVVRHYQERDHADNERSTPTDAMAGQAAASGPSPHASPGRRAEPGEDQPAAAADALGHPPAA